jgi:hypothetical protein
MALLSTVETCSVSTLN